MYVIKMNSSLLYNLRDLYDLRGYQNECLEPTLHPPGLFAPPLPPPPPPLPSLSITSHSYKKKGQNKTNS